jgi:hypothetical protein
MSVAAEVIRIEGDLARARIPLSRLLERAEIDRSTWDRWRSSFIKGPRLTSWMAAQKAATDLLSARRETGGRSDKAAPARPRRRGNHATPPRR